MGRPTGNWFENEAAAHGGFDEVELVDLGSPDLPLMNEPHHPVFGQYVHQRPPVTGVRQSPRPTFRVRHARVRLWLQCSADSVPFVNEDRTVTPNDTMLGAATDMLDELVRTNTALQPLRGHR